MTRSGSIHPKDAHSVEWMETTMSQQKKSYDVWYETIDLATRRIVPHTIATNVDWKTALMIKRIHKRICAMTIKPAASLQRS